VSDTGLPVVLNVKWGIFGVKYASFTEAGDGQFTRENSNLALVVSNYFWAQFCNLQHVWMLPEKCICSQETVKMKIEQETEMACKLSLESLFADKSVTECELCRTEFGQSRVFPTINKPQVVVVNTSQL